MRTNRARMKTALFKAPEIHPSVETGLSGAQVRERKQVGLVNAPARGSTKSIWKIIFTNVFTLFNIVLFAITAVMIAAGIKTISSYVFLGCDLCNIAIGIVTDIRAKRMAERLRILASTDSVVIRDGQEDWIHQETIVLSDIVVLSAGDQIVVDGIVREGSITVDESLLTGESVGVHKSVGDQVLSGSYVVSGKAKIEATAVGALNYADSLRVEAGRFSRPKSELRTVAFRIFRITALISVILGAALFLASYFRTRNTVDGFDFYTTTLQMSGSVVAMIPTGLYLLTSITLTRGVVVLGKRRMSVQELYSIETLARVDTICFDKTGTLTDGSLNVSALLNHSSFPEEGIKINLLSIVRATGDDNPTAKAIREYCGDEAKAAIAAIPFDSEYKYSAAQFEDGTWAFGAPGFAGPAGDPNDPELAEAYEKGMRIIGVYYTKNPIKNEKIDANTELIAYLLLEDHIKPDAADTIRWFAENDVAAKVISGDDPRTVASVAARVGLPGADQWISLAGLSDEEVMEVANKYTVFGRVSPSQKAILVKAMQGAGHSVAMTGDGVNDIVALKAADCSIAMSSGSSAAKNISHLIAVDNNFSALPDVVFEGRRVINNLQRTSSLFLSKTIFAVTTTLAFFVASFISGQQYPFETSNLILWEFAVIGGGGMFLAFENSKARLKGGFWENIVDLALPGGVAATLVVAVLFIIYRQASGFLSFEAFVATSILGVTMLSLANLFRLCLPWTKYRIFVFCLITGGGSAIWLIDLLTSLHGPRSPILGLDYSSLTGPVIGVMFAVVVPVVILYLFITSVITRRKNRKKEHEDEN